MQNNANKIEKEQITYKVVPIKNWSDYKKTLKVAQPKPQKKEEVMACNLNTSSEEDDAEEFTNWLYTCMKSACIINNKTKTYTIISRDPEFIIKTLKGEVKIVNYKD